MHALIFAIETLRSARLYSFQDRVSRYPSEDASKDIFVHDIGRYVFVLLGYTFFLIRWCGLSRYRSASRAVSYVPAVQHRPCTYCLSVTSSGDLSVQRTLTACSVTRDNATTGSGTKDCRYRTSGTIPPKRIGKSIKTMCRSDEKAICRVTVPSGS